MGCNSPQNASMPNITTHHLNRLLQISQIGHSLNVNKKYQHLTQIETSKQMGSGFRKTYAYYALVTKEQMDEQRKQFWETRVNGQSKLWEAIKLAIEMHDCTSQGIIENQGRTLLYQNKLTLLNDSIQMTVDMKGNKYEVPIFCINEALSYSNARTQDKNLRIEYQDKNVEVTIRSSKYPNGDLKFHMQTSSQIQDIKSTIKAQKQLNEDCKIRLFYNGREMKQEKTLGNYQFKQGTVIQAMIF